MKTVLIIQARMGSSRLPGKVLKPLGNSVVLDYVVSRCVSIAQVDRVIVATSSLLQDEPIRRWCTDHDIEWFQGSEDDVLSRFYECAKPHSPDYVVRVTADCPFVDIDLAENMISAARENPADIVRINGELPRGIAVEVVSFSALEYMHRYAHEPRHREHVTYYAYEHSEDFRQTFVHAPDSMRHPQLRITLDTEEDCSLCEAIADRFEGDKLVSSRQVVDFLLQHPEVAALNAHVQQKPVV